MRVLLAAMMLVTTTATAQASRFQITPERTAIVRATYENVPADILGIVEPIEVQDGGAYWDGGTSYTRLTDAQGTDFLFCLDGRGMKFYDGVDEDFWTVSMEYIESRHLYLHAKYPSDTTAVQVQVRGPEEAALYGLLLRWAMVQPRTQEVAAMQIVASCPAEDRTLFEVHRLLETFDWRFGIMPPQ